MVALRKESVDRNHKLNINRPTITVALRKESVDRNHVAVHFVTLSAVALRKESVDRNIGASYGRTAKMGRSPQGERG